MLKMRKLKLSRLKKYPTSISLFVAGLCIALIFLFQNCADYLMNEDGQSSSSSSSSSNKDLSSHSSQMSIHSKTIIDISTLIAYYSSQPYVVRDELHEQTDVTMNFVYVYPLSAKFRWSVKRGFKTVVNGKRYSIPFFGPYQFAKKGAYDIFANSYGKKSTLLTKASKRLIIGEECDIHRIIEFELTDGSLTTGQSATFELEEPDEFDNITWKTSLNTDEVESESLTIDKIPDNVSHLYIGVSAEEESESACLTYRQKVFQINKKLTPHTNTFRPFDKVYRKTTITLENNWIYKYQNPAYGSDPQDFFIDVEHADRCRLKINDDDTDTIDCDTQEALFPDPKSTDLDLCQEDILTLTAKRDDNKKSIYQKYYQFCPARGSASCLALCYFGPLDQRPFHHTCLFESLYGRDCTGICYGNFCGVGSGPGGSGCGGPRRVVGWAGTCTGDPGSGASTTSGDDPGGGAAPSPPSDPGSGAAPSPPSDPGSGTAPSPPSDPGGGSEPEPPSDPGGGSEPEPVDAQCGDDCGECDLGHMVNAGSTPFTPGEDCTWDCAIDHGGWWALGCTAHATIINGQCPASPSSCGGCLAGEQTGLSRNSSSGLCRWTCAGEYGGTDDECEYTKPVNGSCNERSGGCHRGNQIDVSEDGKTWKCEGLNGGETVSCELEVINGQCGSSLGYCIAGNRENLNTANGYSTWDCLGINGGTDAEGCSYTEPPPPTQPPPPPPTQPPPPPPTQPPPPPQPVCSSPGPGCNPGTLNCTDNTNQHGDVTGQTCSCTLGGSTISCGTFSSD